jgi:hypothetical protein
VSFKEWCGYMKEEWEFHKRHPEMFIMWATYAYGLYIALKEDKL